MNVANGDWRTPRCSSSRDSLNPSNRRGLPRFSTGTSRATLARRFHDLVGQTPIGYLTSWRLTLAADVLTETDTPLEAVARQVGYGDAFALSAAFKRVRGISPSHYRQGRTIRPAGTVKQPVSSLRVARIPDVYEGWGNWLQTQQAPEAGARASGPFLTGPKARIRCPRSTISWF